MGDAYQSPSTAGLTPPRSPLIVVLYLAGKIHSTLGINASGNVSLLSPRFRPFASQLYTKQLLTKELTSDNNNRMIDSV
jgi:hypothetical protein